LLQLSFDGGVADFFILQYPVSVDREGVRDRVNAEEFGDRALKSAVATLHPGHLVFCDELFPFLFVGVEAHTQDDERLALKLARDLAHVRQRLAAGTAPGSPEIGSCWLQPGLRSSAGGTCHFGRKRWQWHTRGEIKGRSGA